ncbi:hypothetical protein, partial [Victivallis vadensis]|uniref:hypothetical protein n=1 Tax=Victivallis vadensis TaxID=172901 RepID=UPI00266C14CB
NGRNENHQVWFGAEFSVPEFRSAWNWRFPQFFDPLFFPGTSPRVPGRGTPRRGKLRMDFSVLPEKKIQ